MSALTHVNRGQCRYIDNEDNGVVASASKLIDRGFSRKTFSPDEYVASFDPGLMQPGARVHLFILYFPRNRQQKERCRG